jgi:hypothetical protein
MLPHQRISVRSIFGMDPFDRNDEVAFLPDHFLFGSDNNVRISIRLNGNANRPTTSIS